VIHKGTINGSTEIPIIPIPGAVVMRISFSVTGGLRIKGSVFKKITI
jgi:hypothetical protein